MTTVDEFNAATVRLVDEAIAENLPGMVAAYERTLRQYGRKGAMAFAERAHALTAAGGEMLPPSPDEIFDEAAFLRDLRKRTRRYRQRALQTVAGGLRALVGISFDVGGVFAQRILDRVGVRFRDAVASEREMFRHVLNEAVNEGWTVPQTTEAIRDYVNVHSKAQATQLARTDLIGITNAGSISSARVVFPGGGITKQWLATEDERTRPTHVEADGQQRPLDQPFTVGGFPLDFPGDPAGPDAEVCNCRCTIIYADIPSNEQIAQAYADPVTTAAESVSAAGQERWPAGEQDGVESPTDGGKYRPKDGGAASGDAHEIDVNRSGFMGKLVDKDGVEIGPDDTIVVYHATTPEIAEKLRTDGFEPGDKIQQPPTIIDSEIVAKMLGKKVGDPLDYEPGRGQGAGLYVGPAASNLDQYGTAVVGIKVRVSDLTVPPERRASGRLDAVKALMLNDGYIERKIEPEQVITAGGVPADASATIQQTSASAARPKEETMSTAAIAEAPAAAMTTTGGRWRATLCVEGVPTEDGRFLERGAITWRSLPLSLMGLLDTGPGGHEGASVCGRMDRIWREGDVVWAEGVFAGHEFGQKVEQLVVDRMVDGVSVDLAILDHEVRDAETGMVLDVEEQMAAMLENRKVLFVVTDAVIGTATVCPFQAIEGAKIEALVAGGMLRLRLAGCVELPGDAITASAAGRAPELPPAEWFENPGLRQPTALTVDDDGRVYGHAALWGSCHTAYSGRCVTPPRDEDYSLFHLGEVVTREGTRVGVGQITMRTGHAAPTLSQNAAVEHYDHTGVAAADVRCGNDEHGIWIAGAIRPDLSIGQLRELTGAKVSGDWRRLQGGPWRMLGLLAVNVPGYPVPRAQALVASGDDGVEETVAIVAAGIVDRSDTAPVGEAAVRAQLRALGARAAGGLRALGELAR